MKWGNLCFAAILPNSPEIEYRDLPLLRTIKANFVCAWANLRCALQVTEFLRGSHATSNGSQSRAAILKAENTSNRSCHWQVLANILRIPLFYPLRHGHCLHQDGNSCLFFVTCASGCARAPGRGTRGHCGGGRHSTLPEVLKLSGGAQAVTRARVLGLLGLSR